MAMKRKRASLPKWGAKKRRTPRRLVKKKYKIQDLSVTSRALRATDTRTTRKRLLPKRVYRRKLWELTRFYTKYKAISLATTTVSTPASFGNETWAAAEVFQNNTPFWLSTGGLQPTHEGGAVPTLAPATVVVRGGSIKVDFVVGPTQTDSVKVRYQLIYPKQQSTRYNSLTRTNVPVVDWTASIPTTQYWGWTLQTAGDYSTFYYEPVLDKTIILKPGDSDELVHRLKIRRIDCDTFTYGDGMYPLVVVYAANVANNAAVTLGLRIGYDLSFAVVDL